jgi:hypothetical protein
VRMLRTAYVVTNPAIRPLPGLPMSPSPMLLQDLGQRRECILEDRPSSGDSGYLVNPSSMRPDLFL